jgi:1-acyl-sn-glycerol-3-phosphate acyltransferase
MNSADTRPEASGNAQRVSRARSNPIVALSRLAIFSVWTMYCYFGCRIGRILSSDAVGKRVTSAYWTHRWFQGGARIAGVHVELRGAMPAGPALITPNHLGYFDLLAVGSVCPTVFVSKADVRSWPLIGHFFDMSEHIGVSRSDRRSLTEVNAAIAERLSGGQAVCVFLEGTTSGGVELLPFHASLAQPAVDTGAPIVPMGLLWEADSDDITIAEDVAYWRPEHRLVPHAWHALGLRGIRVTVNIGEPIRPAGADRKTLAAQSRAAVLGLLEQRDAAD